MDISDGLVGDLTKLCEVSERGRSSAGRLHRPRERRAAAQVPRPLAFPSPDRRARTMNCCSLGGRRL